jgi:hypothetical protein
MPRLIDLYPGAWRDRYAAEFADLLAERPASVRDRIDIVMGAVDAWIHPQVAGHARGRPAGAQRGGRVPGAAAAVLGGVLLIVAALGMRATEINAQLGYKDVNGPIVALVLGMILVSLAAVGGAAGAAPARRPRTIAAVAMLGGALLTAMPWPVLIVGFLGFAFAGVAYGLITALREHQPPGVLIAIGSLLLTSMNTEDDRALLTIPLGVAWIVVGLASLRPERHAQIAAPLADR